MLLLMTTVVITVTVIRVRAISTSKLTMQKVCSDEGLTLDTSALDQTSPAIIYHIYQFWSFGVY